MNILNPITDAAVLALDPALDPEHRLQSLLRLWLGNYFTGTAFTTRALLGATTSTTFPACDFMWQLDATPTNPQKPLIHSVFTGATNERLNLQANSHGNDQRWLIEMIVKVPANLTGTPMTGKNPEHFVRRLAGNLQWLLGSSEREALSACGVLEFKLERPAVIIPGDAWHTRQVVASCLTRSVQAR